MPGTFSPPWDSDPDMHQGTCVTHVPGCMAGSLTSGFLCSWRRGKRFRHSGRMRNPRFYIFANRPMAKKTYDSSSDSEATRRLMINRLVPNLNKTSQRTKRAHICWVYSICSEIFIHYISMSCGSFSSVFC